MDSDSNINPDKIIDTNTASKIHSNDEGIIIDVRIQMSTHIDILKMLFLSLLMKFVPELLNYPLIKR